LIELVVPTFNLESKATASSQAETASSNSLIF